MNKTELFGQKGNVLDKPELRKVKIFFAINAFLLITNFLMPQYFGIHLGWDITCTRFADILLVLYGLGNIYIFNLFSNVILRCSISVPFGLYLFVALYTMVIRTDINAFMIVFLEIFSLYALIIAIRYVIGVRKSIKIINFCGYFLSIYGFVEFLAGESLYLRFLSTVPNIVVNCYRSGFYRIMGPCGHPLGYGLLLIVFIAFACIDEDNGEMFLYKRPILLAMLLMNVFLTGSRSSLAIAIVEIICIMLFSNSANRKKSFFYTIVMILGLVVFILLTYNLSIGKYIMMQITMLIDEALGTQYSLNYGADVTTLQNSESYREYLPLIFKLDWLNPLVGRGLHSFAGTEVVDEFGNIIVLNSVDNYYICQYIKYAYPGLFTYVVFIVVCGATMLYKAIKLKSEIIKVLFIGFCCYFYNLWWVDALQTLKFVYVIVALFYALTLIYDDNGVLEKTDKVTFYELGETE